MLPVRTIISYRARGWVTQADAQNLVRAVMPQVDMEALGHNVIEYPCVFESGDGPCEVTVSVQAGANQLPECRIRLRAESQEG